MLEEVIWRKKAADKYISTINYLKQNWSDKVALDFIDEVENKIELLKLFPHVGSSSKKRKGLKKFILTEQNMLIYTIYKKKLVLLNIYDTRIDPIKIEF